MLLHDSHTCTTTTSVPKVFYFGFSLCFLPLTLSFFLSAFSPNKFIAIVFYCRIVLHYLKMVCNQPIDFIFAIALILYTPFFGCCICVPQTTYSPATSFIYFIFRPLTSYNKRESCASSATTTTLLGPPPGNYISQRGSNGALHLYAMPRAISPLMQVNCACARMYLHLFHSILIGFDIICMCQNFQVENFVLLYICMYGSNYVGRVVDRLTFCIFWQWSSVCAFFKLHFEMVVHVH